LPGAFPTEANDYADAILIALEGESILVPAVWALEVANGILVGERSKRLRQPEISHFVKILESLALVQDAQPLSAQVSNVLPLAREYHLSAYDASYLELSIRHGVPLATLDGKLCKAAQKAGVRLFKEKSA
jgi:predicted nucleic acid-binding protein